MKAQIVTNSKSKLTGFLLACFILLLGSTVNTAEAQTEERKVSGVIRGIDGPVSGASIILKGTAIWASTDDDGFFTFPQTLKQNDILVITSLGYYDKEVVIEGDTSHIEPILEDIEIVIVGALRTSATKNKNGTEK